MSLTKTCVYKRDIRESISIKSVVVETIKLKNVKKNDRLVKKIWKIA